ncbi:MAG: serine/threonine protein kinase [Polyangiaceae bacterium]|nr:serine/threonine protein kinase [Polyangiaceae bacterium]
MAPVAKDAPLPALGKTAFPRSAGDVEPGFRLGRYEILARLGGGGMANVWIGRAAGVGAFERLLAIKTVHPELAIDPRNREMFVREARMAATIRHANVVELFDFGEDQGVLYQVLSLVEGADLATLSKKHGAPLPAGILCTIVQDALRGLHAAHESRDETGRVRGLVHRDISPQNILVGLDGVSRVSDFGISKALGLDDETTGSLRGKFGYFAPERARKSPEDRRSDIFAMGVVLWEGLTGRRLFRGKSVMELLSQVTTMPIEPADQVLPGASAALARVAARALARPLEERFATAEEMGDAMRAAAREEALAPSTDEVARFVEALMGSEVRERIQAASASPAAREVAPGAGPAPRVPPTEGTASYVTAAPGASEAMDDATVVTAEPVAARTMQYTLEMDRPPPSSSSADGTQVLLAAPLASPAPTPRWRLPAALAIAGLLACVVVLSIVRPWRDDAPVPPPTASAPAPTPEPLPAAVTPPTAAPSASVAAVASAPSAPFPVAPEARASSRITHRVIAPAAAPTATAGRAPPFPDNPFRKHR